MWWGNCGNELPMSSKNLPPLVITRLGLMPSYMRILGCRPHPVVPHKFIPKDQVGGGGGIKPRTVSVRHKGTDELTRDCEAKTQSAGSRIIDRPRPRRQQAAT